MVFSSLVFLYAFFPCVLIFYFICKNRTYRNSILLLFSLLFYSWGEPRYILLMIATCLFAYVSGLLIDKFEKENKTRSKKVIFIVLLILLVGNLLVFKYLQFFTENINYICNVSIPVLNITLPIGISFYTFQILSYVIDLYRGKIAVQKNFFNLTLYVSFFPQLIAGPIVRYETIEEEIDNRKETFTDVVDGMKRFIIGLSKKVIIANNVALIAEIIYQGDANIYGTFFYWIAAIAYALQIYFDFSGYSDMAIGLGRMFGFHFLENFNYPYISLSITDFWRRWHISLSSWFRDYIYIPLGGNRVSKLRWIINIIVVWSLTGFWHGAQWNFIIWGFYYCILLLAEKLFLNRYLDKVPKAIRWLYTMFFVLVGWVIFNLTDFKQMYDALEVMFSLTPTQFVESIITNTDILYGLIYLPLGIAFSFPLFKNIKKKTSTVSLIGENIIYLGLFMICIVYIISSSYNPFIYFRF